MTHRLLVAEIDVPFLLGYDFLVKYKSVLDLGCGELTCLLPTNCAEPPRQVRTLVTVLETTIIPPSHEVVIGAVVKHSGTIGSEYAVLEVDESMQGRTGL